MIHRKYIRNILIVLTILIVGYFAISRLFLLVTPPSNNVFIVTKQDNLASIAYRLEKQGIIKHLGIFRRLGNFLKIGSNIKYGELVIASSTNYISLLYDLTREDKFKQYKVILIEGETVYSLNTKLKQSIKLMYNLKSMPAEGSLLPDTYYYKLGDTAQDIINTMQLHMINYINSVWGTRNKNINIHNIKDAIILASLVQSEGINKNDFVYISRIFMNRLKINMKLQSDITALYGHYKKYKNYDKKFTPPQLARLLKTEDSRYNTYKYAGLPPTAISNPSKEAINAVMHPVKENNYLYFYHDNNEFKIAKTYKEHKRNIKS